YDLGCNIYSPDGRVFQIEYAGKAVENSGALIGLKCKDGVVIGVEKLVMSKLLVEGSGRRVHPVGKHAGIAFTGYTADGRAVVSAARAEVENYEDYYGVDMPPHVLSDRMGHYFHAYTTYGGYRPFGLCTLMTAFDEVKQEPFLHMVEPSGLHYRFHGCAVGKAKQAAKTEVEKLNLANMTCAEALKRLAFIIHTIREEDKDKPFEFEAGWITKDTNWEFQLVPKAVREEADKWGKKRVEEIEMQDDDSDED
ncbi:Proteasome subunit alpha type-3, partial [Durusdinium trenchii]